MIGPGRRGRLPGGPKETGTPPPRPSPAPAVARVQPLHVLRHHVHSLGLRQLQVPRHVAPQVVPVRAQQLEVHRAHAESALPVDGLLAPAAQRMARSLLAVFRGSLVTRRPVIPFLLLLIPARQLWPGHLGQAQEGGHGLRFGRRVQVLRGRCASQRRCRALPAPLRRLRLGGRPRFCGLGASGPIASRTRRAWGRPQLHPGQRSRAQEDPWERRPRRATWAEGLQDPRGRPRAWPHPSHVDLWGLLSRCGAGRRRTAQEEGQRPGSPGGPAQRPRAPGDWLVRGAGGRGRGGGGSSLRGVSGGRPAAAAPRRACLRGLQTVQQIPVVLLLQEVCGERGSA